MKTAVVIIAIAFLTLNSIGFAAASDQLSEQETLNLYKTGRAHFDNKDYEKAYRPLVQAAQNGDRAAGFLIGVMQMYGLGVEQNHSLAATSFMISAMQGFGDAQYMTAFFMEEETVTPVDRVELMKWYLLAVTNPTTGKPLRRRAQQSLLDLYPSECGPCASDFRKALELVHAWRPTE
ncbi:tetratricopeptide repeat protein [Hwanghaeella sp.]|uniref:tetratricopeptide repeat protein n=1 Tax=Hwanghaeella sp. TaxID=2605943 RepID=UPI003CCBC7AF